jgi:hypothetical protein
VKGERALAAQASAFFRIPPPGRLALNFEHIQGGRQQYDCDQAATYVPNDRQ